MKWMAVHYGTTTGQPCLEHFATQHEAVFHLKETAQSFLDAGEQPALIDEWFVARVTHEVGLNEVPFGDTSIQFYEVK